MEFLLEYSLRLNVIRKALFDFVVGRSVVDDVDVGSSHSAQNSGAPLTGGGWRWCDDVRKTSFGPAMWMLVCDSEKNKCTWQKKNKYDENSDVHVVVFVVSYIVVY